VSPRPAALLLLAAAEVVAGVGFRSEALAARSRVQVCRERRDRVQARREGVEASLALLRSPEAILLRARAEEADARLRSRFGEVPEL